MNNDEDESSEDDQPAKMEEGQEEAKQEYKEFWFAEIFSKVEDVINNNENVKIKDIFEAIQESCKGTNA